MAQGVKNGPWDPMGQYGSELFGYRNVGLRIVADYASIMELKKNVTFTEFSLVILQR